MGFPKFIVPFLLLLASAYVQAEQRCDCQKIIGKCRGAVEFLKAFGSKPSYGAEIIIHSSEKRCSKVEYFLDSTPHHSILVDRQKETESLFGTSPIRRENVVFHDCHICAPLEERGQGKDGGAAQDEQAAARSEEYARFRGTWKGTLRWMFVSAPVTLSIDFRNARAYGVVAGEKGGPVQFDDGQVQGDTLTFSHPTIDGVNNRGSVTFVLKDENTASLVTRASNGVDFSGDVRRVP